MLVINSHEMLGLDSKKPCTPDLLHVCINFIVMGALFEFDLVVFEQLL